MKITVRQLKQLIKEQVEEQLVGGQAAMLSREIRNLFQELVDGGANPEDIKTAVQTEINKL